MHGVFNACLCFHVRVKFSSSTPLVFIAHAEMQKMTITHAGKYVRPLQKQQPSCNHQFCDHIYGSSWSQVQIFWLQSQHCAVSRATPAYRIMLGDAELLLLKLSIIC